MEKKLTNRDIESIRKKKKIYTAAMELFQTYGYEQVTMKMISAVSEMSEGSIYHYFREKAGILEYVKVEFEDEMSSILTSEKNVERDPKDVIFAYLSKELELYESLGRELVSIVTKRTKKSSVAAVNTLSELMDIIQPALTEYIQNCLDRGKLHTAYSATEIAYVLTAHGAGLTSIWCNYGERYSLRNSGETTFRILIDSLFEES